MKDTSACVETGEFSSPSGLRANRETMVGDNFSRSTQRKCLSCGKQRGSKRLRLRVQITIKTKRSTRYLLLLHISLSLCDLGWAAVYFCCICVLVYGSWLPSPRHLP